MNYCAKFNALCESANAFGYCSVTACTKYSNLTNSTTSMSDGVYMELFAVKNGIRYNAKIVDMKDASTILTNGLMDGIEKLWT